MARIENFLTRNALPHHLLDPATDREAQEVIARYAPKPGDLPLVVAPDGDSAAQSRRAGAGACARHARAARHRQALRRRGGRLRPGRTLDRGLCRLRRPVRGGAGPARIWRPGRRQRADRELFRLPDRHIGHGAGRPRLCAGAEIRQRDHDPGRDHAARLHALPTAPSCSIPTKASAFTRAPW